MVNNYGATKKDGAGVTQKRKSRGIALVTVLLTITILVTAVLAMSRTTRTDLSEAANLGDRIKLFYMAKSGFYGAEAILALDKNNYDALTEDWAKAEELAAQASLLFGGGSLTVAIEDESGKIPLHHFFRGNAVSEPVKAMLLRLLKRPEFGMSGGRAEEFLAALQDWLDPDDEPTGTAGAESKYYRSLPIPYEAKNGPLDTLAELLMIRGMTKELFFGKDGAPGLSKFLTIYGEGKININTAPLEVVASFREGLAAAALEKFDLHRRDKGNDLSQANWYKAFLGDDFDPAGLVTVKSEAFLIRATASKDNMSSSIEAVVQRKDGKTNLVAWKAQ